MQFNTKQGLALIALMAGLSSAVPLSKISSNGDVIAIVNSQQSHGSHPHTVYLVDPTFQSDIDRKTGHEIGRELVSLPFLKRADPSKSGKDGQAHDPSSSPMPSPPKMHDIPSSPMPSPPKMHDIPSSPMPSPPKMHDIPSSPMPSPPKISIPSSPTPSPPKMHDFPSSPPAARPQTPAQPHREVNTPAAPKKTTMRP